MRVNPLPFCLTCLVLLLSSCKPQAAPTAAPTQTPTSTATASATATATETATPTVTNTPTTTPTATATPTHSLTPTPSRTETHQPTRTNSPPPTPTVDLAPIASVLAYYPLAIGDERVYTVTITYVISITKEGVELYDTWQGFVHQQVVGQTSIENGVKFSLYYPDYPDVYTFPMGGGKVGPYNETLVVSGNNIYQQNDLKFIFPLVVGSEWLAFGADSPNYAWRVVSQEDIETPAGHFSDCYDIQLVTSPDTTEIWFCNGIGVVKIYAWHHPAWWLWEWELIQYDLK